MTPISLKIPELGASISEEYREWKAIKGIQLEREVRNITASGQLAQIKARYTEKFLVISLQALHEIAVALSKVCWYILIPSRMYTIDNSLGLGHRDEILLS